MTPAQVIYLSGAPLRPQPDPLAAVHGPGAELGTTDDLAALAGLKL